MSPFTLSDTLCCRGATQSLFPGVGSVSLTTGIPFGRSGEVVVTHLKGGEV